MHILTIITTLTALSAGALAAPALSNNGTTLFKRGAGSIGAFKNPHCTGPVLGDRPDDKRKCIKFTPRTIYVGINWGNSFWDGRAAKIRFYKTDNCEGDYRELFSPPTNNNEGTNACVSEDDYGGGWHSVKFYGIASEGNQKTVGRKGSS